MQKKSNYSSTSQSHNSINQLISSVYLFIPTCLLVLKAAPNSGQNFSSVLGKCIRQVHTQVTVGEMPSVEAAPKELVLQSFLESEYPQNYS